jgi:glycosyltransferase involved in cell wall biosynthesis
MIYKNPVLSIIIPTKNRYNYLSHLIISLSRFKSTNYEVIIQDNSDNNEQFADFFNKINDSRIKYYYVKESLSIIENSELAIKNSIGEYLCFIGDDDGILEVIIEFAEWMKKNFIDSAVTNRPNYYWPDIVHKVHNFSGSLSYTKFSKKVTATDSNAELIKCLRLGGGSLELMPRLYHGIVSRKTLDKLYEKCLSYFPGPSPDMANAVALSTFIKTHVFFDCPVIIAGAGFNSAGGAGARKAHIGRIDDLPFLPKNTSKNWEELIPKIWTGQTIWAESAIKALRSTNNESFLAYFNYNYLYASFFVFHYQLIKDNFHFIKSIWQLISVCYYAVLITCIRIKYLFMNFASVRISFLSKKTIRNIENINKCIITLDAILALKNDFFVNLKIGKL